MLRANKAPSRANKQLKSKSPKRAPLNKPKRAIKTSARKTIQRSMSTSAAPNNGWTEGPKGVKRPISPSIQIWKFSPVAYMHVGSRIAGSVLAGGFALAGLYGATVGCDITQCLDSIKVNAPVAVPLLKMSIVFPLAYHGLSGARQIYQDFTAKGYDHEFQEQSSYAIAGATTLSTLYLGLGV